MTTSRLNGRIHRLEAAALPALGEHACRTCRLRHVQPLTIALLRSVLRVRGGTDTVTTLPPPLCLCDACCGGTDRWLARLSHGLPDEGAA
jgi:hypothetical protein